MNKNSKKTKGFPKKLLALMLCCFCLLATMPISAAALETEETQMIAESIFEQQSENDGHIAETVSKTELEAEDGTEVEMEIEAETEVEIEVEAETEPEAESETVAVTAAVIEAGSNPDAESKADVEIEVEVETATESETEAAAENVAEIAVLTVAGLEGEEVDAVIDDGTVANDESKMVAVDETEASSETETEVTSEAASEVEIEADATGAESDAVAEVENVSEIKAETEATVKAGTETAVTSDSTEALEQTFYDKLINAETCQSIYELINENTEQALALSDEQVAAVRECVEGMEDDGYKMELLGILDYLLSVDEMNGADVYAKPGGGDQGGDTGNTELNADKYNSESYVFWDTVTSSSTTNNKSGYVSASRGIAPSGMTVQLNGLDVEYHTSDGTQNGESACQLDDYFPDASAGNENETGDYTIQEGVELLITPPAGYYVSKIVVACCSMGTSSPHACNTWEEGNAYDEDFSFTSTGAVPVKVSSLDFSHFSGSPRYFILIELMPVPTPLYVQYDYGNIVEILTGADLTDEAAVFTRNCDDWTDDNTNNNYGTGEVQTNDTQMKYAYAEDDPSQAAEWSHTTNTVTQSAKEAAAAAGYYFVRWDAEMFESAEAVANNTDNANDENYIYTFVDSIGTGTYGENTAVTLKTHTKLTAIWEPIKLNVTKTVTGLAGSTFASESHPYTIQVQKLNATSGEWENYSDALNFSITGDGTQTQTLSPITPGTYRAVETGGNENLSNSTTIMYITVSDGGQVTYDTANIQTSQEITVTNSYSSQPATYDLAVQKTVSGNMYDANKEFAFTVTYGDETATFNLKKDATHIVEDIPVGTNITVSEVPDGYTYSFVSITDGVTKTDVENGISFTMPAKDVTVVINNEKNVTVDTGILLDTLPYILILGVVAFGAILLTEKRRDRDDD